MTYSNNLKHNSDQHINMSQHQTQSKNENQRMVPKSILNRMPPAPNADQVLTTDRIYTLHDANIRHLRKPEQNLVRDMLNLFSSFELASSGRFPWLSTRLTSQMIQIHSDPNRTEPVLKRMSWKTRKSTDNETST